MINSGTAVDYVSGGPRPSTQCHPPASRGNEPDEFAALIPETCWRGDQTWHRHHPFGGFPDRHLAEATATGATLEATNLGFADLRRRKPGKRLPGNTNLAKANLKGADLRKANLTFATLRGMNMQDSDLRNANLEGANFENANLESARLGDATLDGVQLENTICLAKKAGSCP
ncbi:MAG: pentapeptide repeat-containing protein [Thermoleophilia bacterium]|nr:pentapeptide repeat-containing protein [Thermoleophilia bacterium]